MHPRGAGRSTQSDQLAQGKTNRITYLEKIIAHGLYVRTGGHSQSCSGVTISQMPLMPLGLVCLAE
jgi:hypothetical protein